jgi:hypothetical protein
MKPHSRAPLDAHQSAADFDLRSAIENTDALGAAKALAAGASIQAPSPRSANVEDVLPSPLALAMSYPHDQWDHWEPLVQTLLRAGADPLEECAVAHTFLRWSFLHQAVHQSTWAGERAWRVMALLVDAGADVNARVSVRPELQEQAQACQPPRDTSWDGATPLMAACRFGLWPLARRMLGMPGVDLGALDDHGRGLLHSAAQARPTQGHEEFLEAALAQGAALDEPDHGGLTPLMLEILGHDAFSDDGFRPRLAWFLDRDADVSRLAPGSTEPFIQWVRARAHEHEWEPMAQENWQAIERAQARHELAALLQNLAPEPESGIPRRGPQAL